MGPPQRYQRYQRADINIANKAELRANAHHVLATIREQRPENTRQVYAPKQKEFKVFASTLYRLICAHLLANHASPGIL